MSTRASRAAAANQDIRDDLIKRSRRVTLVENEDGRWNIRCYDRHGYYIGGRSNITDKADAEATAELYRN